MVRRSVSAFFWPAEQAAFDTFKNMVPCEILDEAVLLYGSRALHDRAKVLLAERPVPEKLAAVERAAALLREEAEWHLLGGEEGGLSGEELHLFYSAQKSDEFEQRGRARLAGDGPTQYALRARLRPGTVAGEGHPLLPIRPAREVDRPGPTPR